MSAESFDECEWVKVKQSYHFKKEKSSLVFLVPHTNASIYNPHNVSLLNHSNLFL